MRLHTNTLRASDVRDALAAEQAAGRIARTVGFRTLSEHRSNTHVTGIEVQLTSWDKEEGDGRRRGNDGSYGAMQDEYAATYDEWGWLIAACYSLSEARRAWNTPEDVWGSVKNPVYSARWHFDQQTALSYNPRTLIARIEEEGEDPYPFVRRGAQGAKAGRVGAARLNARQTAYQGRHEDSWARKAPRTVADVERFAHLEAVTA